MNRARWDLCGGCSVTGIPTAIRGGGSTPVSRFADLHAGLRSFELSRYAPDIRVNPEPAISGL